MSCSKTPAAREFAWDGACAEVVLVLPRCATTLQKVINSGLQQLPPARRARLFAQLLRGVGHLHARGVLHRDLSPTNVLLDGGDELVVADLGSAHRLRDTPVRPTPAARHGRA